MNKQEWVLTYKFHGKKGVGTENVFKSMILILNPMPGKKGYWVLTVYSKPLKFQYIRMPIWIENCGSMSSRKLIDNTVRGII